VSDLHSGPLTDTRLVAAAVDRIALEAPDLLLLGGDYVSLHHADVSALAALLAGLKPRLGIFGVFGNHDLWQDDVVIAKALAGAGVRLLVNEEVRLPEPHAHVVLYGMDDPGTGSPCGPSTPLGDGDFRIVLMHSPLGITYLTGRSFLVALCGHTHGGQIALPSGTPIVLPRGSGDPRHARGGLFPAQEGQILVSRGLGMSDVPIRIFAPSEIHLCTCA
jgi:predicted MPP superfamily phosphohydrolase